MKLSIEFGPLEGGHPILHQDGKPVARVVSLEFEPGPQGIVLEKIRVEPIPAVFGTKHGPGPYLERVLITPSPSIPELPCLEVVRPTRFV